MDFTGVTCTNCKYNEKHGLPAAGGQTNCLQQVRARANVHGLAAGGARTRPTPAGARAEGGGPAQPTISSATCSDRAACRCTRSWSRTADGKVKVLGVYDEGKINQPDRFARWLQDGLEKASR